MDYDINTALKQARELYEYNVFKCDKEIANLTTFNLVSKLTDIASNPTFLKELTYLQQSINLDLLLQSLKLIQAIHYCGTKEWEEENHEYLQQQKRS